MSAALGWALALAAVVVGWLRYGWPGLLLAASIVVFWLLLQFSRSLRVMRDAAGSPIGTVPSAVMLQAGLALGLPMLKVVGLTKSLGRKLADTPETWRWRDASGASVEIVFEHGRVTRWKLERPDDAHAVADESISSSAPPPASAPPP